MTDDVVLVRVIRPIVSLVAIELLPRYAMVPPASVMGAEPLRRLPTVKPESSKTNEAPALTVTAGVVAFCVLLSSEPLPVKSSVPPSMPIAVGPLYVSAAVKRERSAAEFGKPLAPKHALPDDSR